MKLNKLLASLMLGVALVSVIPGCGTTANNRAVKTEQVLIPSVNIAMEQWAERVKAGKATTAQIQTVKTAYINYYNTQVIFKAALEKSINQANSAPTETELNLAAQAVADAKDSLVNIINQFVK